MCYNDFSRKSYGTACRLQIRSFGDGWQDCRSAVGELCEDDGRIFLEYTLEGDKCTLCVSENCVTQKRIGAQNLSICFREGEKTLCTIGSGSLSGSFEIFTKKMTIVSGKGGIKITLDYFSGTDGEHIRLCLTAAKIA